MIEGAIVFLGGALFGRVLRRRHPKPKGKAICGCGHSVGFHANLSGPCAYVPRGENPQYYRCKCQHYDGPVPIDQYFAIETLPPNTAI